MLKKALVQYLIYIVYFLGIGMVSSGIVLMPFNMTRYGIILFIGLLLFITGSVVNEVVLEKKRLSKFEHLRLIGVSLVLAIGIGMISGGIAHFKESPEYVTFLIPIGVMLSFTSFMYKNGLKLTPKQTMLTSLSLVSFALVLHYSLSYTADYMGLVEMGGDVFKGHGM